MTDTPIANVDVDVPDQTVALSAEVLDELERAAPEVLTRGLPGRVIGQSDALLAADLDGRPWSQLLAAAVCHDVHRGDLRAQELVRAAWKGFEATGDRTGMGMAAHVRANLALGRGDIPAAVAWWRRAEELLGQGPVRTAMVAHSSLDAYAKGDLAEAERCARDALLAADAAGDRRGTIVPLVYLALYAFCAGDLDRLDHVLRTAETTLAELSEPEARNDGALVAGFRGVLEAVRGNQAESDRHFAEGLRRADADDAPWYDAIVRTLRAEFSAPWAPHRSLLDARQARTDAERLGDRWWHGLARLAEGTALSELGQLDAARDVLVVAIDELSNPLERAWAQMQLGEVLLRCSERPAARAHLDLARQAFESAGARWWATRCALAMGSADRDRGGRWVQLARTTAAADPAYERLFEPAQDLRIDVMGRPSVVLDGDRVQFLTRHAELAVYLLAIARAVGLAGLAPAELIATLWPGVDERRAGSRLRTVLWQARNALGAEAWRVQRRRDLVSIDLTGVAVDLRDELFARRERSAAAGLAAAGDTVPDGQVRAAKPSGRGGDGGMVAVTTDCLLTGWDVAFPPSLDLA